MADTGTTYTPDPDLTKLLASTGETLLQFVSRHVELIKTRESTGSYPGDGPRSEQIDSLLAALKEMRPVFEIPPPLVGVRRPFETYDSHEMLQLAFVASHIAWNAFQAAVDTEMSWLFPERDPLGASLTAALREVQNITQWGLERAVPETASDLNRYASLAVAVNAIRRQMKLHGNSVIWRVSFTCRIAVARLLWWLGGGERR